MAAEALNLLEWIFWLSMAGVAYAYAGYPLVLYLLVRAGRGEPPAAGGDVPSVTVVIPVHNERPNLARKLENTRQLRYPSGRLDVVFVSDGSTDGSTEMIASWPDGRVRMVVLPARSGKAAALNAGLDEARGEIVVFSDASIALAPDAIVELVKPFADPTIGCVSGEDRISQSGGEGLYGRYELGLRRLESRLHSIVGASGSLYAQRRALVDPFVGGLAPDFLSVLRTVEKGYRAVSQATAIGEMAEVSDARDEFSRKVRTILRGLATLNAHLRLLNPFRFGWFAFELLSHKVVRWLVPFFLLCMFLTGTALSLTSIFYFVATLLQAGFYALSLPVLLGWRSGATSLPVKISVYFATVNLATLSAWLKYSIGERQEIWSPSRR